MTSQGGEPPLTLNDVDSGVAIVEAADGPTPNDIFERRDVEVEALAIQNKIAKSKLKSIRADRRMRKRYATEILEYLYCYSVFVGLITLAAGWRVGGFSLPTEVLAALGGSTAVAAIGLVGFIARGLFQPPKE